MREDIILFEDFSKAEYDQKLEWFEQPKEWRIDSTKSELVIESEKETDFWQNTHYGFQADNGHFLHCKLTGDFTITTKVTANPINRYDQSGLMVRFSKDSWIKSSVEHIPDGNDKLGAVVTNYGYSDWSTQEIENKDNTHFFRITKVDHDFYVDYSRDGLNWKQIRIAHLFEDQTNSIDAGIYACSPQGKGYQANFDFIKIQSIKDKDSSVYL
ncbi:DUF1349 domain-containing protein [Aquibacillus halophilus]|uniref:DUF1349 domain-containing protein n=1 Tax=Aquibacillus halophilus TaxID=930132 RepID=A0A6A8D9Q0_9BACI|nr:DUF1349 domain-containing protein [Aquibacillus halophilus]